MNNFSDLFNQKLLQFLFTFPFLKLRHLRNSISYLVIIYYRYFSLKLNPFFVKLFYFVSLSFSGFLVLAALKPRSDDHHSFKPRNLDIFFTSVSAATLSSMSTVEMEVFSNSQLIILTFLMFLGGEVFTSIYIVVIHFLGVTMVLVYVSIISSAKTVLKNKGLKTLTFSIFTTVSTFASCGFVPTNENMMVFSKNSGLLLILIPQVLLGNTLFPSCLRFSIWVFGKFNLWKENSDYLLKKNGEIRYLHLLPSLHSWLLVPTVFGFILVQFVLFCSLEWSSDSLRGLNWYQKTIGVLFQCVNTRHTGETIVDLSIISPAILVLFVLMM
ncbi:Cation transporter [Parasponia andersonii]|uniref:Cation transporter n=1 Tax=Parasponia andersonii TaxID=3476 RepID=A0A2P5CYP9_PARAD|nr:Cation transporter [Parasponia andersonii]